MMMIQKNNLLSRLSVKYTVSRFVSLRCEKQIRLYEGAVTAKDNNKNCCQGATPSPCGGRRLPPGLRLRSQKSSVSHTYTKGCNQVVIKPENVTSQAWNRAA